MKDLKTWISEIHYLSFEGGGGKGNAYVGAVAALQKLGILKFKNNKLNCYIKGISGASAGAITAFFIGSGFSYNDLYYIMLNTDFDKFFTEPCPGVNVVAGKSFIVPAKDENRYKNIVRQTPDWLLSIPTLIDNDTIKTSIEAVLVKENPKLAKKVKDNLKNYIVCLISDFGLFHGNDIQEKFFEYYLQLKIYCINNKINFDNISEEEEALRWTRVKNDFNNSWNKRDKNFKPCTFKQHHDLFGVNLAFTSVNFRTANVEVFSYKTTPDFPISTAALMSMSLPLIFKPVIINNESLKLLKPDQKNFEGLWVDGGLFDNAPVRIFNDISHTLLLRLGNRMENNKLNSLIDFLITYLKIGILGSGSGQVNKTTVSGLNVIELDVSNLSLLKFNLTKTELDKLTRKNKEIVLAWFH